MKTITHQINRQWCKGCGICVAFCPKEVLGIDREEKVVLLKKEECIGCRVCEYRCPDLAIEVIVEKNDE